MRLPLSLIVLALTLACGSAEAPRELLLATTTSVEDSGLLDALLPRFREATGIRVKAVAVGTGAALRMGAERNADVLITHAPDAEEALLDQGALSSRLPFMENYFVIAGPPEDPAGVGRSESAAAALRRVREAGMAWVSRGDDSGTHRRERALWRSADLDPEEPWDGFTSTGSGMGLTLQVAGERRAYLLSDIGTFLAFRDRIGLVVLSPSEPALRNVYSVLRVDPEAASARAFEAFLIRDDIQELIGAFGVERFGRPLFNPLHPPASPSRNGA